MTVITSEPMPETSIAVAPAQTGGSSGGSYRWYVLAIASALLFSSIYGYDALPPVADLLVSQLHFDQRDIGLLQAVYSFPNIFTVLIGGVLVDRVGIRRSLLMLSVLCFVGMVVATLSGRLWLMAAGRLMFGMGAESLMVGVLAAIGRWFRGKEVSFAFGLSVAMGRVGGFAALNSPSWAKAAYVSWRYPFIIAAAVSALGIAGAVLYGILEAKAESQQELASAMADKFVLKDLFRFGTSYWYVVGLCVVFYSSTFPFQTFAVKFFMDAHGTSRELGSFINSLLTLAAVFATPLFGLLVDRVGRRALLMVLGSLLLIPAYQLMAYTHISLSAPMTLLGIGFSLIPAVMWPSVAYVVDQTKLGTAYGLMAMIQNMGLFSFNLLVGWANDYSEASASNPQGYRLGLNIFTMLGILAVTFAYLLRRRETGPNGHGLETLTTATSAST
jgi:MFS family permease